MKKLTLTIDESVLERAHEYAKRHDTSLSQLVSTYLTTLTNVEAGRGLSPRVRRLHGILPQDASPDEYRGHLEDKYLR